MNLSIATTNDKIIVTNMDDGKVMEGVQEIQVYHDTGRGRAVTALICDGDATIQVIAAPAMPADPGKPAEPGKPAGPARPAST